MSADHFSLTLAIAALAVSLGIIGVAWIGARADIRRDSEAAAVASWERFFASAEFQKLADQAKADIDAGLATPMPDFDDPIWENPAKVSHE